MPVVSTMTRDMSSNIAVLKTATDEVDTQLQNDRQYSDLGPQLGVGANGYATLSGINDFDYPDVIGIQPHVHPGVHSNLLHTIKRIPLPEELFEQFQHVQANVTMGLFAEISRAWLAIDSDIYVWNFEDGSDVAYFDGLDEVILTAGLITPKPGVFQDHIRFLLCLTTPLNIVVLGVGFADQKDGKIYEEMHLQPQPLFTVSTDNVFMTSVSGLWNGRIFLSGADGCLYELAYHAQSSWFRQRCKKINHSASWSSILVPSFLSKAFTSEDAISQIAIDNTRNTLYGRTENGSIQVYDAGENGSGMRLVTYMNANSIAVNASHVAKNVDRKHIQKIVHIAPISRTESTSVHLVAITDTGLRLYFSTTSPTSPEARPSMLRLVHVRMPPGFTPSGTTGKPSKVHQAFYRQGTTMMIESSSEEVDSLWCLSQESFPFQSSVKESQVSSMIEGKTWCATEIPDYSNANHVPPIHFACQWPEPPAIVSQHVLPQRRFVVLSPKDERAIPNVAVWTERNFKYLKIRYAENTGRTVWTDSIQFLVDSQKTEVFRVIFPIFLSMGSHIITTLRPVEQLRELFIACGSGESEAIESFFKFYGVTQACAMCLILICHSPAIEKEVVGWAVHAFFRYDSSPTATRAVQTADVTTNVADTSYIMGGPAISGSTHGSYLASPIQRRQQPQSIGPQFSTSTPAVGLTQSTSNVCSGKHSGIALYLARILGPIWNHHLVIKDYPDGKTQQLVSRLSSEDLSWFIESLRKLKEFMARYSNMEQFRSPNQPYKALIGQTVALGKRIEGEQEAAALERNSLINLSNLIRMCCEVLELWRTLCDNQIHILTMTLPQALKEQFLGFSFKDFVLNGQEISAALIGCLMTRYLDDQATVDAINAQLRDICPTLFSADDATYSKANEMVHFARHVLDPAEKNALLVEAIKMYFKVPALLDLPWICEQLEAVRYFDGIIELALYVALKRDPQATALHFYKCGEPRDDTQGKEAFLLRCEAYKCILEVLNNLYEKSIEHPHPIPMEAGPPVQGDPNALTAEQAKFLFEQTLKISLKNDDELFHVTLYKWMMSKDLTERLLEISSQFLEHFIVDTAAEKACISGVWWTILKCKHPNDIAILDLLWKYHQKRKNYLAAAKVLIGLAERESDALTIQDRVAYISRAIMCAKNSSAINNSNIEGEFLHELEEKLELHQFLIRGDVILKIKVARIQYQVHQSLTSTNVPRSSIHEKAEALNILDSKLIDISQLYGDFAHRFDLLDCKLSIVHCAGHQDQSLIETIWKEIIDKAVRVDGRMVAVSQIIISTGKMYIRSQGYFPLDFVIFYLEKVSCQNDWDPTWVFVTLKEVGVPLRQLWIAYDKLFRSKETTWQAIGRPLHLFNVVSLFMKAYLENTTIVSSAERPAFTRALCEACSGYLVELESMNESQPLVRNLLSRFRSVLAELKREF